ncbi:MAG TPA: hypothetical protein VMM93_00330, partial [Vicinamibacterales bacterium]|nr:hypothetical protein [Vicinamibacterales bacterium]
TGEGFSSTLVYMWDASRSTMEFWTVGGDGRIAGYRSVMAPVERELHYRAQYEPSATDADVLAGFALVYRPANR